MYITITALLIMVQNVSASVISGSTPYNPQDGAKYYFEAQYDTPWPACNYRFMSSTDNCGLLDIWQAIGVNQEMTLIEQNEGWKLETKCPGITVEYSTACGTIDIGTGLASSSADFSDIWRLVPSSTNFAELHFEAVNRDGCQQRYLTYNSDCSVHTFELGTIEDGSDFLMHPVESSNPVVHHIATPNNEECADPFVWMDPDDANHPYRMICTGGDISLYSSAMLGREDSFTNKGVMLGGDPGQTWASNTNRWAPENIALGNLQNLAIFSAPQPNNVHRLGVVKSTEGAESGKWNTYSSSTLDLGGESGDIDAHFFRDNGKIYLLWKTDDNAAGLAYTRLWINEVSIPVEGQEFLILVGEPTMILDSRGLWWVDSWVANGSLIEGPQLLKHGTYYYLFFASGKYCQPSYSQGVARSTSIFGTYTKLGVPLLSTGIVGVGTTGAKLVGPGHASFVQDQEGQWFSVFHASEGVNCNRRPYVEKLRWSDDDWPVVVFDDGESGPSHICIENNKSKFFSRTTGGVDVKLTCKQLRKKDDDKIAKICSRTNTATDGTKPAKDVCVMTCKTCKCGEIDNEMFFVSDTKSKSCITLKNKFRTKPTQAQKWCDKDEGLFNGKPVAKDVCRTTCDTCPASE